MATEQNDTQFLDMFHEIEHSKRMFTLTFNPGTSAWQAAFGGINDVGQSLDADTAIRLALEAMHREGGAL